MKIKIRLFINTFLITLLFILILIVILISNKQIKDADDNAEFVEERANFLILFIVLSSAVIMLIVSSITAHSISRPIEKLIAVVHELKHGNFNARADIKTSDELEELAEALNTSIQALGGMDEEHKQLDRAKTELLSVTSHELRSPMTPIKAQLQMVLQGYFGKLNKGQKQAIEIAKRNAYRLDQIIQDFLQISRIESGRLRFNFIKTSLKPYIKELVREMRLSYRYNIILAIGRLSVIEADPYRVMQVLRNLIANAIKFSNEKGKVIVTAKQEEDCIMFSVQDFGIGIAKENFERIFEPFFQEEQTIYREYRGTGLGLATCKGIVESQDGKIWFESEKHKGSTFYFTVPLKPVKEIKPISIIVGKSKKPK